VIVVDTNLLVADIEALRARIKALHKPVRAILVTHAHPDHFNGIAALVKDAEIPVYAAPSVARVIEEIAEPKRVQWSPVYGTEWPAETYFPNTPLNDGQTVQIDETSFTVHEMGPGESHADSYFTLSTDGRPHVAFTGDLAFHHTHPYTADGHTRNWLATLETLARDLADVSVIYPGHGDPARASIFADQRRYLLYYREMVRRLAAGEPELTEAARAKLETAMQAFLPDAPLTWMIGLGADAVAAELAAERGE
jgi:glyoxylase-like metal-dependent hydrolase (beta-lactamase superfamily II)